MEGVSGLLSFLNAALIGVLGLVIGSFLNVVIYRMPQGRSIVYPGSHCPVCRHRLSAHELIPVVSYVMLKGRCAACKTIISWRYPAVELLTAVAFIIVYVAGRNDSLIALAVDLLFVSLLLALTMIDINTLRLPDVLVALVAVAGVIEIAVTGKPTVWQSLGGALGAGSLFFVIAYFYPQGMGFGDVKFVAALGLYLGAPGIIYVIFLASLSGVIIGALRVVFLKKDRKDPIPFGPFLAASAFIVLIDGARMYALPGL